MDKIWVVETEGYIRKEKTVFHTEAGFNNYISKGGGGRIRIYDLSSDKTSEEYRKDLRGEFKKKMRESKLGALLLLMNR